MIKTWTPMETSQLDPVFSPHQELHQFGFWPSCRLRESGSWARRHRLGRSHHSAKIRRRWRPTTGGWLLSLPSSLRLWLAIFLMMSDLNRPRGGSYWLKLCSNIVIDGWKMLTAKIMSSSWVFIATRLDSRVDAGRIRSLRVVSASSSWLQKLVSYYQLLYLLIIFQFLHRLPLKVGGDVFGILVGLLLM